jgi:hypothetical protein
MKPLFTWPKSAPFSGMRQFLIIILCSVEVFVISCVNENGGQRIASPAFLLGYWIPRTVNWKEGDFSTYYFVDDSTAVVLSSVQKNLHDSIYFATEPGFNIKKGVVRVMGGGRFSITGKTIYRFIKVGGLDEGFQDTVSIGEGNQSMVINGVAYIRGDRYTQESKQRIQNIVTEMVPDIQRHPEKFE